MTKQELFQNMKSSAKRHVDFWLSRGNTVAEAIKYAKTKSTAGGAVWAELETDYAKQ